MNKFNPCLRAGLLFLAFFSQPAAPGPLFAGAPLKINFQGRLEESGQPAEGSKSFVFKIYNSLSGGSLVWTSQAQSVAVANGVFSVVLETGTPVNLSTAAFSGARYVEITVDGVPLSPRQEMVSAPYALVAQSLSPDAVLSLSSLEKDPSSASTINTSTNAVDWTQLKNVPAGLADGVDDGGAAVLSTAAIVSGKFSDERVSISTGAFYGGFNGAGQLPQLDGAGKLAPSALGGADAAAQRAALELGILAILGSVGDGEITDVSPSKLSSPVGVANGGTGLAAIAADNLLYASAPDTLAASPITAAGRALVGGADAAAQRAALGLGALSLTASELDPVFTAHASFGVGAGDITNWNSAFGWGNHASAGYAAAAALNNVAASTGTLNVSLAAVIVSTGGISAQVKSVAASTGTLTVSLAAVALSTGSISAQVNSVAASTGALTVSLAAVAISTGSISVQVNNVAASTGTLTVNLAAVALSTGNISAQVNSVAASTGTLTVSLAAVALSTGNIASQVNNVAASTGTLTANLAAVALSTGNIASQVNNVAASTGALTADLAAVVLSTGNIASQVNNVAASTGALTADLAAVVLSTGPLANSGTWSGGITVGGAVTLPIVRISGAGYNSELDAYPLGDGHRTVVADTTDDNIYVSLPDAASVTGRIYSVKNFDPGPAGNATYITTFAGQTIDDDQISGPPYALTTQFESVTLQSDGSNWLVIN